MEYAERYLPKDIELFLITPKKHNHYKLKKTKIIEVEGGKINFVIKLRKFCKEKKIDLLVNLGSPREPFGMLFSTIFTKTNFVVNLLSNPWDAPKLEKNKLKRILLHILNFLLIFPYLFAKKIILASEDLRKTAQGKFFFIKDKFIDIPLIVNSEIFYPENKNVIREKLKLPKDKKIILYVGRMQYLKGADILFEIIKKNPNKLFILVGQRDSEFSEQNFKNVKFIQSAGVNELRDYYNAADLFIFPSRIEAYGMVHREAMLCGTPSLVSDITSLRITKNSLMAGLSPEEMQKQIDLFFSLPNSEVVKLSKKGREYILKENSFDILSKKYRDVLLD